ncbi:hypothetical protein EUGRSUZ_F03655 [Eucalyptus grandis]|uniref:Uncharacterized protein n=2 Tax=Eucalyptus grandis TaxID=71139 RepID=A0A059BXS6_EUCGR|nr:hypothetical protein EUGRSUZ_F03655 [Eucalyptus grandis]
MKVKRNTRIGVKKERSVKLKGCKTMPFASAEFFLVHICMSHIFQLCVRVLSCHSRIGWFRSRSFFSVVI